MQAMSFFVIATTGDKPPVIPVHVVITDLMREMKHVKRDKTRNMIPPQTVLIQQERHLVNEILRLYREGDDLPNLCLQLGELRALRRQLSASPDYQAGHV